MTKRTIRIGIPAWKTGENSIGVTLAYVMLAEQFGEAVFLMPNHEPRFDLDLLMLPGGPDINPAMYGQKPSYMTGKPDLQKDYFDAFYLPKYINAGVPVFSICRGHQAIAVWAGGTLIQHMSHETNKAEDPYKCVHKINIDENAFPRWREFTNKPKIDVNSRHHQSVKEGSLPADMIIIARHDGDNSVEMIAHRTLPIVGIQGHPEDIYDPDTCDFMNNILGHLIFEKTSILA